MTGHLQALEAAHRHRGALGAARHRAEVDGLDLDWAAYQLARQHDDVGNFTEAARCYRMAAANDFADAAFRLGNVLEMLAAQRADSAEPGYHRAQREELALVSDAARWYAEAYAAGHPEAVERLDGMIARHDTRRPAATSSATGPVGAAPPAPGDCEQGGLDAVVNGSDLTAAAMHFRKCITCQREFVSRGGLLTAPARQAASGRGGEAVQLRGPLGDAVTPVVSVA